MTTTKSYSELIKLDSYMDRFRYLKISGYVGDTTFGSDRYINQALYSSQEWKKIRNKIIIRDNGCDLGCNDRSIEGRILIHHINPITVEDIFNRRACVFDEENLICVSHITHNAIHYGDESLLIEELIERTPNDTCPWKKGE